MSNISTLMKSVMIGLVLLALGACAATYRNHGYIPTDGELDLILVGVDTRETVASSVGRPTSTGVLADGGWYYAQSRWRHHLYKAPQEIERQLVAISFDGDGVVENIERFALEDGQVVTLSRRVTESNIRGVTFIGQILSNIGNFDAGQVIGEN
ncbi:outer membrane protein assembly factor BamE [Pseudohalocynthiibacter aestuariivivens]|jgi:outer membrane protein assembly factor BamE (lipoprotein component of BamABCDE complex)|uniref:Outer membrane protein assembly factor BamE n=1 Tax=Pseudohalocynthiibacter aestuariivivens TaxID=1591409 RepID=A0ABV5JFS8_9RHOB|nr:MULTISPECIES: outer membrane protein assembly factor BamE [Pseudohalocynthiibacter]MBS9716350.1 outer membrane protein assembly factor BamE [Pseudohalocynthiibacter aestuariivivens]MCK0100842.1 outer membrane protein assembly factor BamE [Pseudohalocynthiibacter sp. F2068]